MLLRFEFVLGSICAIKIAQAIHIGNHPFTPASQANAWHPSSSNNYAFQIFKYKLSKPINLRKGFPAEGLNACTEPAYPCPEIPNTLYLDSSIII